MKNYYTGLKPKVQLNGHCALRQFLEETGNNVENIGIIVMTKSTKRGLNRIIGSVTSSVVKRAKCIVMIVPNDFSISIK